MDMKPEKKSTYNDENQLRLKSIAAFLKEYRIQSGFTQELLSEYAELSRFSVIRVESGKPVSFVTICKYASGLGLPLHQLFLQIN